MKLLAVLPVFFLLSPQAPAQSDPPHYFRHYQKSAVFPGGSEGWRQFIVDHINGAVAARRGAPRGNYHVLASFVIDTTGHLTHIEILADPGYGCGDEVKRLLGTSPVWEPSVRDGLPCPFTIKQPFTFVVN